MFPAVDQEKIHKHTHIKIFPISHHHSTCVVLYASHESNSLTNIKHLKHTTTTF